MTLSTEKGALQIFRNFLPILWSMGDHFLTCLVTENDGAPGIVAALCRSGWFVPGVGWRAAFLAWKASSAACSLIVGS